MAASIEGRDRCFCIFPSLPKRREFVRYLFEQTYGNLYPGNHSPELSLSLSCSRSVVETAFTTLGHPGWGNKESELDKRDALEFNRRPPFDISYFWDISRAGNSVESSLYVMMMMMVVMMMEWEDRGKWRS